MVAVQRFEYAERTLLPGEEFSAEKEHAKLLKIVGRARDADPIEAKTQKPAKKKPGPKRGYNRRDMRARP
jgi:hypothetical protein